MDLPEFPTRIATFCHGMVNLSPEVDLNNYRVCQFLNGPFLFLAKLAHDANPSTILSVRVAPCLLELKIASDRKTGKRFLTLSEELPDKLYEHLVDVSASPAPEWKEFKDEDRRDFYDSETLAHSETVPSMLKSSPYEEAQMEQAFSTLFAPGTEMARQAFVSNLLVCMLNRRRPDLITATERQHVYNLKCPTDSERVIEVLAAFEVERDFIMLVRPDRVVTREDVANTPTFWEPPTWLSKSTVIETTMKSASVIQDVAPFRAGKWYIERVSASKHPHTAMVYLINVEDPDLHIELNATTVMSFFTCKDETKVKRPRPYEKFRYERGFVSTDIIHELLNIEKPSV